MPQLDFALVCDYVRVDGGVAHALGGGFDTITVAETPAARTVGFWSRILLARNECDRDHRLELIFQAEDGERLTQLSSTFNEPWEDSLPAHWRVGVGFALNIGFPLPHVGLYSLEMMINDSLVKSIPLRVVQEG